jgi:hypothetical protein
MSFEGYFYECKCCVPIFADEFWCVEEEWNTGRRLDRQRGNFVLVSLFTRALRSELDVMSHA